MKKYILIFISLIFSSVLAAKNNGVIYSTNVLRVVDGDTVVIAADFLPKPLKPELALRVYGVDTPEKGYRAKCDHEATLSEKASAFTKKKIAQATSTKVLILGWDKYGGRVLGDLILDSKSLREMLINEGLAREYYGEKKQSWC